MLQDRHIAHEQGRESWSLWRVKSLASMVQEKLSPEIEFTLTFGVLMAKPSRFQNPGGFF